jgi:hypothetical protein
MNHSYTAFVCVLVLAASSGFAQITVQKTQIEPIFVIGDSINMLISNDTTVNIGKFGGPIVYNFSSLDFTAIIGGVTLGSSIPVTAVISPAIQF